MSVGGPSQQMSQWNLMGNAGVARTSEIVKRRERGSRQTRIVWGETTGPRGTQEKPARNPGLSSFHLGAADLVIHAARTTARHRRSSDVEDYSISPQHVTLRDMARAQSGPNDTSRDGRIRALLRKARETYPRWGTGTSDTKDLAGAG